MLQSIILDLKQLMNGDIVSMVAIVAKGRYLPTIGPLFRFLKNYLLPPSLLSKNKLIQLITELRKKIYPTLR